MGLVHAFFNDLSSESGHLFDPPAGAGDENIKHGYW